MEIFIKTKRLKVFPLCHLDLDKFFNDSKAFSEKNNILPFKLNNTYYNLEVFKNSFQIYHSINDLEFIYSTLWIAIECETNNLIGHLNFKGIYTQNGEVEIGYVIFKEFQNQKFMFEFGFGVLEWLFNYDSKLKAIVAYTDISNIFSQKLLKSLGFKSFGLKENQFSWELTRLDFSDL